MSVPILVGKQSLDENLREPTDRPSRQFYAGRQQYPDTLDLPAVHICAAGVSELRPLPAGWVALDPSAWEIMRVLRQFVGETRHQRVGRRVAWTSAAEVAFRPPGTRTRKAATGRRRREREPAGFTSWCCVETKAWCPHRPQSGDLWGWGGERMIYILCAMNTYLPPGGGEV